MEQRKWQNNKEGVAVHRRRLSGLDNNSFANYNSIEKEWEKINREYEKQKRSPKARMSPLREKPSPAKKNVKHTGELIVGSKKLASPKIQVNSQEKNNNRNHSKLKSENMLPNHQRLFLELKPNDHNQIPKNNKGKLNLDYDFNYNHVPEYKLMRSTLYEHMRKGEHNYAARKQYTNDVNPLTLLKPEGFGINHQSNIRASSGLPKPTRNNSAGHKPKMSQVKDIQQKPLIMSQEGAGSGYYKLGSLGVNKNEEWNEKRLKVIRMKEYSNVNSDLNNRILPMKKETLFHQIEREKQEQKNKSFRTKALDYIKNRFTYVPTSTTILNTEAVDHNSINPSYIKDLRENFYRKKYNDVRIFTEENF